MVKLTGIMRIGARSGVVGLVLFALVACSATYRFHGYAPNDDELAQIVVGQDTRDTVAEKIGRPGASGLLRGSGWYYVQSDWEHFAYRAPREIDRQVVAISFSEGGVVTNVERFGLEDGEVVALSRRVTDSGITGVTFLRQLFGNLGRFTADQFFN